MLVAILSMIRRISQPFSSTLCNLSYVSRVFSSVAPLVIGIGIVATRCLRLCLGHYFNRSDTEIAPRDIHPSSYIRDPWQAMLRTGGMSARFHRTTGKHLSPVFSAAKNTVSHDPRGEDLRLTYTYSRNL